MSDLVKKLISDPNITEAPTKISLNAPEIDKVTLILREGSYFSKDQKIALSALFDKISRLHRARISTKVALYIPY